MANHGRSFGLSAELKRRREAKYSVEMENQAARWLEQLTGEHNKVVGAFSSCLRDGTLLCHAINVLCPGSVRRIHTMSTLPFRQMENIGLFLEACERYGVPRHDLFQTVDLYEEKNLGAVVDGLHALGRAAQRAGFGGPVIGARPATQNKRTFSPSVLTAGRTVVPALALPVTSGQRGMTAFGTGRQIGQHASLRMASRAVDAEA